MFDVFVVPSRQDVAFHFCFCLHLKLGVDEDDKGGGGIEVQSRKGENLIQFLSDVAIIVQINTIFQQILMTLEINNLAASTWFMDRSNVADWIGFEFIFPKTFKVDLDDETLPKDVFNNKKCKHISSRAKFLDFAN